MCVCVCVCVCVYVCMYVCMYACVYKWFLSAQSQPLIIIIIISII